MKKITPVILSGGSGTRLWPTSRKDRPKQFTNLLGGQTLFQAAALRLSGECFEKPVILTHSDFRFVVTEQLTSIGIDPGGILIEPASRNTAPAVLAATLYALEQDPDAILLVAPSDHIVPDTVAFQKAVETGRAAVAEGRMVTFGVVPTRPETGYGYLSLQRPPNSDDTVIPLSEFVEKPDLAKAKDMIAAGNFMWNAGIFLFAAKDMKAAFEAYAPDLVDPTRKAVDDAQLDLGFVRLAPEPWSTLDDVSIDYAIMERHDALSVVPYSAGWSDLGSWDSVRREMGADKDGVSTSGPVTAIETRNVLLRAENTDQELVAIGVENLVVIATKDAVLVTNPAHSQHVGKAVTALKAKGKPQAEAFPMDHRPWGHFETLALGGRFQVKRIVVKPGAQLSLQSHHHRSEHWIVVSGTAKVTVDGTVSLLTENEAVYIPLGARHRLENPGKIPMVLIEVQTGAYLGEDDIERHEDVYARGEGAKG